MPQLDTSTWLTTVISATITLFIIMQLKIRLQDFPLSPTTKTMFTTQAKNPWELKWTKIYLPLSLPPQ